MIRTLDAFVRSEYPNHDLSGDGAHELSAHTAVAEFASSHLAPDTVTQLRDRFGADRVATVTAAPPASSDKVIADRSEDTNSMAETPKRRPLVGALALGIVVLLAVAVGTLIVGGHPAVIVVSAVFAAILGFIEGGIIFGGARFAGEKAWVQENVPNEPIEFAAVFATSEADALEACKAMSAAGASSVRIVSDSGAWHLPNLYTASE